MARRRIISGEEWTPFPGTPGEFYSPEPTPIPRNIGGPRPEPTPTNTPDFYENDRGVFRNDPSATIYPSGPDYAGFRGGEFYEGDFGSNRPHAAMDYADPVPNRPHTAMDFADTPESFPATGTPRLEPSFLFGGPTVETPTGASRGGNLDNEPSLFPSPDDWWKGDMATGAATRPDISSGDGGSIWEGNDTMGGFVGDSSLGSDLSADLGGMGFGENYPATPEPVSTAPADIPVEPTPLPQPTEDSTWTTSPEDRRFLPALPEASPAPEAPTSTISGVDIRNFGGQRFGDTSGLSLGAFLNAPLETLRYGGDRYVPQITTDAEATGGYNSSLGTYDSFDANGNLIRTPGPPPTGSIWDTEGRDNSTANTNPRNDGTGTTIIPIESADATTPRAPDRSPSGLMTPQAYERATWGGVRSTGYRDPRGSATFDPRAANLQLMASQAFGGTPNDTGTTSDAGVTRRYGMIGRLNEFGEYEQTGEMGGGSGWTGTMSPFIYGSARPGVRGIPSGRGG